ncbi:prepilin peptidase [Marinomonas gallaica]|uniref:prepilin peptidase n=1 Tax=Marinomonas gallaica TaxID=1806667 RepID=UPI0018D3BC83
MLTKISIEDFCYRQVKHKYLIILSMLLLFTWFSVPNYHVLPYSVAILVSGLLLFSFRLLGAGDTKLLVVLSFGVDPILIPLLLYATVLLGCLLALIYWAYGCITNLSAVREKGIPYAIPISISGWSCVALSYMDWFSINL